MPAELRFVFDTNVLVSALLLKSSVVRRAFDEATRLGKLLVSAPVVEELNYVLSRREFEKYISESERTEFISAFVRDAILIEVTDIVTECRDPKDNKFLALALSGRAECVVSGDDDVLALHPFRGIPILKPREFLDRDWEED